MSRASKSEARYEPKASHADHCAICAHFHPPDECSRVEGKISPQGWCKYFKQARGET